MSSGRPEPGKQQGGWLAALVEPSEAELAGKLGGAVVLATSQLPADLAVAVTAVAATTPAGWCYAIRFK
jgi:hypothetical protein